MKMLKGVVLSLVVLVCCSIFAASSLAQSLTGTLRGVVLDQQGNVVPGAVISLTSENTGTSTTFTSSSAGNYTFPDLAAGSYKLKVDAKGFASYLRTGIQVASSQVSDVTVNLEIAGTSTTVVVESGANVVQTESSQLSGTFQGNSISEIPVQTGAFASVLNLAIFLPNTTTQLGGTSGNGGSVGGLRGRENSFSIDGTDNNDPSVTTATQQVIPDAVQELTVNQNIYSAEYGRGSGGQFNVITKTGTNQVHFGAWLYNINRNYDAPDNQEKQLGFQRRFDFNRAGGEVGGPIFKDKLFLYGAYEFNNLGQQASAPSALAPTAAGLTMLNTLAIDQQVKTLLAQFPVAPAQTMCGNPPAPCSISVHDPANLGGPTTAIPLGSIQSVAPAFTNQQDYIVNGDYNVNQQNVLHARYLKSRTRQPNFGASFPQSQFASSSAADSRRVILNDVWTINSHLVNDFKGSFVRYTQFFPLSGVGQNFPTLTIDDLDSITIGPSGNLPQHRIFDEYTLGDSLSWSHGRHSLKWGGQYFWYISPSVFLQNQRGQYGYSPVAIQVPVTAQNPTGQLQINSVEELLNDFLPSKPNFTLQGLGNGFFSGNAKNFDFFFQDDVKVTRRLTLNLGLRYDFFGNPAGSKANALNSVASLPGTPLVFGVPKQDWNNVGPRLGFAWDPTGSGKWAVRGGAGVAYDVIPWNFYTNANPVQLQVILTPLSACAGTFGTPPAWCTSTNHSGFLADGGMQGIVFTPPSTQAAARAQTANIMADAAAPKVFTWSLSVQHEILKNTSLELRYLGTRALELPVQLQLNSISPFDLGAQALPTYFGSSAVPANVSLTAPTLAQFTALEGRKFAAQGFTSGAVTDEAPVGDSTYHGGAIEVLHRVGHGLQLRANYTYSKTMDNATNDLNTSAVNPRRPQNPFDLANEWSRSALDVTHKVALTWQYELPKTNLSNRFVRGFANGWQWSGSYLFQSGQPVTIQSGVDSNGNLDAAGDRGILNPSGTPGVGTTVTRVCRNPVTGATTVSAACSSANTVGYAANNPTARYVQAGVGTLSNIGRDTVNSPYFNVWNMSILKNNNLTERFHLQLRVEAFDVFNHRNFTLGNLSIFSVTANALSQGYANLNAGSAFLNQNLFNGGSRTVQLGLKLTY
jgi:hypothetical protein